MKNYKTNRMRISIIAAVARNRAIGKDNNLIYRLPNDLKRFKQLTTGNTIIMGRKTFESLPKGALPNRRNIVLTRSDATFAGCDTYRSLDEALKNCADNEDIYIIGGGCIYAQSMKMADRLCLTEIDDTPEEADTFFPDYSEWHETWREEHAKDERHEQKYAFVNYEKKK